MERDKLFRSIQSILEVLHRKEKLKLLDYINSLEVKIYEHGDGTRINLSSLPTEDLILIRAYMRTLMIPLTRQNAEW